MKNLDTPCIYKYKMFGKHYCSIRHNGCGMCSESTRKCSDAIRKEGYGVDVKYYSFKDKKVITKIQKI